LAVFFLKKGVFPNTQIKIVFYLFPSFFFVFFDEFKKKGKKTKKKSGLYKYPLQ